MRALSFHQPRAEQVIRGDKTLDVRTWRVSYRGTLAVHASSKRRDARCRAMGYDPDALAYGALIGTVDVTDIVPLDENAFEALRGDHLLDETFPGEPCYGWRLDKPKQFDAPIAYRGRMRLFEVDLGRAEATRRPVSPGLYRVEPPPEPDPQRPFVLYTVPEREGSGYRVALYQWVRRQNGGGPESGDVRAPGAFWGVELGGDTLRAVADHLLAALRANGYKATDLARGDRGGPFYLDELSGLRLALILASVKPLTRHDRIDAIGQGVVSMSAEEAYYWFSKCSAGPDALRAQKALRTLLADE